MEGVMNISDYFRLYGGYGSLLERIGDGGTWQHVALLHNHLRIQGLVYIFLFSKSTQINVLHGSGP